MKKVPDLVSKHYKLPFIYDGWSYIWDANDNMCIRQEKGNTATMQTITLLLNGERIAPPIIKPVYLQDLTDIFYQGAHICTIRGWGRLQNIKDDKPEEVQDAFAQWVIDVLNGVEE